MNSEFNFFVGLHHPGDARHFPQACISMNRLDGRKSPVDCEDVLLDSGAFTKVTRHGGYPETPEVYAQRVHRLCVVGAVKPIGVVAEDYMCEPFVLARTGLTIEDHQRLTIERYDAAKIEFHRLFGAVLPFEFIPVLQGYTVDDYLRHIEMYGDRLTPGMWVGVGSVCKRQGDIAIIEAILGAIKGVRPDLRLHGFWVEASRTAERCRSSALVQRRQHGLELRSSPAGRAAHPRPVQGTRPAHQAERGARHPCSTRRLRTRCQRLARSRAFCPEDRRAAG